MNGDARRRNSSELPSSSASCASHGLLNRLTGEWEALSIVSTQWFSLDYRIEEFRLSSSRNK
jgi:hypothetical protein